MRKLLRILFAVDAEYEPFREELSAAGLSEEVLRKMDPDDRVAALEAAQLDPYDIFIWPAERNAPSNPDGAFMLKGSVSSRGHRGRS